MMHKAFIPLIFFMLSCSVKSDEETGEITNSVPEDGEEDVYIDQNIYVIFSHAAEEKTLLWQKKSGECVKKATIELQQEDQSSCLGGTAILLDEANGRKLELNPAKNLEKNTKYTVELQKGIHFEGASDLETTSISFTTGTETSPTPTP